MKRYSLCLDILSYENSTLGTFYTVWSKKSQEFVDLVMHTVNVMGATKSSIYSYERHTDLLNKAIAACFDDNPFLSNGYYRLWGDYIKNGEEESIAIYKIEYLHVVPLTVEEELLSMLVSTVIKDTTSIDITASVDFFIENRIQTAKDTKKRTAMFMRFSRYLTQRLEYLEHIGEQDYE